MTSRAQRYHKAQRRTVSAATSAAGYKVEMLISVPSSLGFTTEQEVAQALSDILGRGKIDVFTPRVTKRR